MYNKKPAVRPRPPRPTLQWAAPHDAPRSRYIDVSAGRYLIKRDGRDYRCFFNGKRTNFTSTHLIPLMLIIETHLREMSNV